MQNPVVTLEDGRVLEPNPLRVGMAVPIQLVTEAAFGSSVISYFVWPDSEDDVPFVRGEEHPSLVAIWDNEEDDVFDSL